MRAAIRRLMATSLVLCAVVGAVRGADPPAINPFGPKTAVRDDAVPGYIETSDGVIHPGRIYLTRDKRLEIVDEQLQRQREIPLSVGQANRLRGREGMDGTGVEVQGGRQQ